ncbi:MFS transporter [Desulforhopalus vacuolatus]|uniref:MFS transporter n=1 Tax=Desulforhopalus vacuolatus TaxID=40414 RepID=UPI001962D44E|nr:MFS transporter [Desulforhopalus vacuolatus]MBM9520521.1 MFS transporter [Desulforhopalus vacuolatus]
MWRVLSNCWALFLGMGFIMLGNGLQATLTGVRATMEGFGTTITGLVMSGYFLGLMTGCNIVPKMVGRVGHVRTFGALASLASTSILVQAVFVAPWIWWAMRFVTGFAYAGLFIVVESWINEAANNGNRGKLMSFYMLISLGGMAGGQMLLNLSSPSGFELFVLVSLLVSLAVIPILLSTARAPQIDVMENVGVLQLYRVSPLGVFGMFVSGMSIGAFFGMGAVYATEIGLSVKDVSFFMSTLILGGFLFQYPLGWISDYYGPRIVIIFSCTGGAVVSFIALQYTGEGLLFYVIVATVGGLTMPLYSLCSVYTNDYLTPTQMVAAGGTLVLINAIGASIGSPVTALAMDIFGPQAFCGCIGVMLSSVMVFALWRLIKRGAIDAAEQGDFVVMATLPLSVSLNPDVDLAEIEAAGDEDAQDIRSSFEELINDLENPEDITSSEEK